MKTNFALRVALAGALAFCLLIVGDVIAGTATASACSADDEGPFDYIVRDPDQAAERLATATSVQKVKVVASWNEDDRFMRLSVIETVATWGFSVANEARVRGDAGIIVVGGDVDLPSDTVECYFYGPPGPPVGGSYYLAFSDYEFSTIEAPSADESLAAIVTAKLGPSTVIEIDQSLVASTTDDAFTRMRTVTKEYQDPELEVVETSARVSDSDSRSEWIPFAVIGGALTLLALALRMTRRNAS